jgi:hypothetical protein
MCGFFYADVEITKISDRTHFSLDEADKYFGEKKFQCFSLMQIIKNMSYPQVKI